MDRKNVIIVDDNIVGVGKEAEERAIKLFSGIVNRGIKIKWGSQASINVANNDKLLYLMEKSGAKGLFIGFESLEKDVLKKMGKGINIRTGTKNYIGKIKKIQDHGITVVGGFMIGSDEDTDKTIDKVTEFVIKSKIDATQFTIYTPFPGTTLFNKLKSENRIFYNSFGRLEIF